MALGRALGIFARKKISFKNKIRLFSGGKEKGKEHPYEYKLPDPYDFNELGQRITTIVPCWDGLCIGTSSKGKDIDKKNIDENLFSEYGRVYYLKGPKSNCSINPDVSGFLRLIFNRNGKVQLIKENNILCEFYFKPKYIEYVIDEAFKATIGSSFGKKNGHSGQLHGFAKN